MREASLPFPPTISFGIAVTRQGCPDGSLTLGPDGTRPRCLALHSEEGMAGSALAPCSPAAGDDEIPNAVRLFR